MPAVPGPLAVAYSGGRDSTALLHATWRAAVAWAQRTGEPVSVHALHVHHGLSAFADDWAAHCAAQCCLWGGQGDPGATLHFHLTRLALQPQPGESIEALARDGRHAALADMARAAGCTTILLAHHREDQAETFFLQALRGAGAAGLAAMPEAVDRVGLVWRRPWLRHPRAAIEAYIAAHGLTHIEDDSNVHLRYARNRLRLQVWPALVEAFPQASVVLGEAARHAADAAHCLDALAGLDLAGCGGDDGALDVPAAVALAPPRLRNLLRVWLQRRSGVSARASLIERLAEELPVAGAESVWPWISDQVLRLHRGRLDLAPVETVSPVAGAAEGLPAPVVLPDLRQCQVCRITEWGGELRIELVEAGGMPLERLAGLVAQPRQGGEQFQRAANTPPRALKKQFQLAGVTGAARQGPLLWQGGELVFVPGLGLDARVLAPAGVPQVRLVWCADTPGQQTGSGNG